MFKKIYEKLTGAKEPIISPVRVNKHYIRELQRLGGMDLVWRGEDGDYWTDDITLKLCIGMNEMHIRLPDEEIDPSIHNSHLMELIKGER